jgi:hypothetical protein
MDGTLVMVDVLRGTQEAIEKRVAAYLIGHPDATQNDVEKEVTGGNEAIRAAYKKVRQVRQTPLAHPETGAPEGVRPIEGAPLAESRPPDPTLDPDEHMRRREDGGW